VHVVRGGYEVQERPPKQEIMPFLQGSIMRMALFVAILVVTGQYGCDNAGQKVAKQQLTEEEIKKREKDKELDSVRESNKRIEDHGGTTILGIGSSSFEPGFYPHYFPVVVSVKRGSAAHLAKIQPEDRILTFDDQSMGSAAMTFKKTAKQHLLAPSNKEDDVVKAKNAAVAKWKETVKASRGKDVTAVIRSAGMNVKITLKVPDDGNLGIEEVRGDRW
jgi:hypothetical protein